MVFEQSKSERKKKTTDTLSEFLYVVPLPTQGWEKQRPTAFSLVELLVVMAIISILAVMTTSGLQSILSSSRMDQAGRVIVDEINLARQAAATRNENVELRFIRRPRTDGTATDVYWQVQAGVTAKTNTNSFEPLHRIASLPTGVALETNATLSPLLAPGTEKNSVDGGYDYRSLTIRPTGEIEPAGTPPLNDLPNWALTIVPERDLGKTLSEIKDFITIQIDPLTGRPRFHRP